jgi:hypothetical protein
MLRRQRFCQPRGCCRMARYFDAPDAAIRRAAVVIFAEEAAFATMS